MSHQPCRSGKRHYPTRQQADNALSTLWNRARGGRLPSRAYHCSCGSWHLTSKPYRHWETPDDETLTT